MSSRSRRGEVILGFMSPWAMLLAVVGIGCFTFIPAAVATSPTESLASVISDAVLMAASATLVALAASARIAEVGERLQVTNLFKVITLDATAIVKIDVEQGLIFTTSSGRKIPSIAYGGSVAGDLLGYRRARAAQRRCQAWFESAAPNASARSSDVVIALRPAVWWLSLGFLTAYVAEVLIVRAFG